MNNNIKYKSLDQVLELLQNGYSGKQSDEKKGYPISRIETLQEDDLDIKRIKYADLTEDEVLKYKYDEGDLIFSHINSFEKVGKIALFQNQVPNLIHGVNLLRMKFINGIYPKYAYYFFLSNHSRRQYEPNIKKAINQASLNQRNLKKIRFPMVDFLKQRRIVSKLDALFAEIDASLALIDQNMEQAQALKLSVLDEEYSIDNEKLKIKNLVEKTKNVDPKKEFPEDYFTYLDISSINKNKKNIEEPKTLKGVEAPSRAKQVVKMGDVLFATTRPNLKNIAIVEENFNKPIASTGFCLLRTRSDRLFNKYLFYFLITNLVQDLIQPFIRGAQYPAISDANLKSLKIPLPSLETQQKIVHKLDSVFAEVDGLITDYQSKREDLEALKASLLDSAFKGEL